MKKTLILLFLLASCQAAIAQITFQKKIFRDSSGFLATSFCEMPDGGFSIGGLFGEVIKLNAAGNLEWAVRADSSFLVFDIVAAPDGSVFYSAHVEVSPGIAYQVVIKLDANGEKLWDKAIAGSPGNFYHFLAATPDHGVVATYVKSFEGSQYTKFSADGEIEWARVLEAVSLGHLRAIVGLSGGGFLLGGYFWNAGPSGFLVKTTADGIPLWGKSLTNLSIENVAEFPTGELLASGNSTISKAIVLVKMTAQGDVIWSKAVDNEGFSVTGNATVTTSGDIILRTIMKGNLTGLIRLDANGNLKWARGYPAGNYQFDSPIATQDGGVALLISTFTVDSASHSALLKTTSDDTLPGCESVNLCVNFTDFPTQAENHPWNVSSINHDTTFEATISPILVSVADTCVLFVPPDPVFQIPDTICAGNSITPTGLDQANAGFWNWTFEGGSPDTSTQQMPGEIFFNNPGTFLLQQTVVFGGCPDSFSRNLTVLPSPPVNLGPDTLLCGDESYLLDGSTPGATSYLWENGSSGAQREVIANGVYTLLVSNGLCERKDSVEVRFFDETYPGAFLGLGPDTTLCESDSMSLEAISPGATGFLWGDGSTAPFHPVTQSGTYSATAFFEHCPLYDEVEITLIDCRGKIYIPNAFSPNNDGFNDEFKPYGKDVLLKNLKIFDRWGGLLFDTNQPELGWDGTRMGKPASAGVYVYLLEYEDAFSGQNELESGEVHLVR